jgi:hypothetical protein
VLAHLLLHEPELRRLAARFEEELDAAVGHGHAGIGGGDELLEQLVQPQPRDEVVDQGKRAQPFGEQSEAVGGSARHWPTSI